MMYEKSHKLRAQAAMNFAMKEYRGESYVHPPTEMVNSASYSKLTRSQIDQGVIALVHACNLSGGSVGDIDLYKLIRNYLWHPEARAEINATVKRFE